MNQAPTLFWLLMAMVLIWFGMITVLFQRLKSKHAEKYREMGEPHLLWNNTLKTGWSTCKFLFRREHKNLDDKPMSLLSDFMLLFVIAYTILFIDLFTGMLTGAQFNAKP